METLVRMLLLGTLAFSFNESVYARLCYGLTGASDSETYTDILGAYTAEVSYDVGDTISLKAYSVELFNDTTNMDGAAKLPNTNVDDLTHVSKEFSIDLIRYNGLKEEIIAEDITITNVGSDQLNRDDYAYRSNTNQYPVIYQHTLPAGSAPGIYAFYLTTRNTNDTVDCESYATFVVKSDPGAAVSPGLLVLASTNTWQAYNHWGGGSFYREPQSDSYRSLNSLCNSSITNTGCSSADVPRDVASFVTYNRPNHRTPLDLDHHLMGGERHFLEWLRHKDIPYDMASDLDLHNRPELLRDYDAVVVNTHSEYWSEDMFNGMIDYVDNQNGNLVYLSGNGIFWKVTIDGKEIETRKNDESHHVHDQALGVYIGSGGNYVLVGTPDINKGAGKVRTVNWGRDPASQIQTEANLTGVQFEGGAAANFAGFTVKLANHWVYRCTSVEEGFTFGNTHLGKANCSDETSCGSGGSGWENDVKPERDYMEHIAILAEGNNVSTEILNEPSATTIPGAHVTYYDAAGPYETSQGTVSFPNGGEVFSIGSLNIGRSLSVPHANPILDRMLTNVMERFSIIPESECEPSLNRNIQWFRQTRN